MHRTIEVNYVDLHGDDFTGECEIEYTLIEEDGRIIPEVLEVALPAHLVRTCPKGDIYLGLIRKEAIEEFHNTYATYKGN